jgi:hypothetical protein
VSAYEAQSQLVDVELVEGRFEDRVRGLGVPHTVPGQVGRVVAATEPSLAVQSIVVVKVALPFVSL